MKNLNAMIVSDLINKTHKSCIFCYMIQKQDRCKIVYEDKKFIILESKPKICFKHLLVLSKIHLPQKDIFKSYNIFKDLGSVINTLMPEGWRIVINYGAYAGQVEDHCHFHILGGEMLQNLGGI